MPFKKGEYSRIYERTKNSTMEAENTKVLYGSPNNLLTLNSPPINLSNYIEGYQTSRYTAFGPKLSQSSSDLNRKISFK